MNMILGYVLFVIASTCGGAFIGGLSGLLMTGINNLILVPYFHAAAGSYIWWASFMLYLGSAGFGLLSLFWGAFITYQNLTGK